MRVCSFHSSDSQCNVYNTALTETYPNYIQSSSLTNIIPYYFNHFNNKGESGANKADYYSHLLLQSNDKKTVWECKPTKAKSSVLDPDEEPDSVWSVVCVHWTLTCKAGSPLFPVSTLGGAGGQCCSDEEEDVWLSAFYSGCNISALTSLACVFSVSLASNANTRAL